MRGLVVVLVAALVLAAAAAASGGISGSFTTTIGGQAPSQLKGVWHVTWANGTDTIAKGKTVVVRGHYAVAGNKITFSRESGPAACTAPGVYHWSLHATVLTLKVVHDTCLGRTLVLTSFPLHKNR